MRLEDATALKRRSATGYIERSEDVLGCEPRLLDTRLEDDTTDVCKVVKAAEPSDGYAWYDKKKAY